MNGLSTTLRRICIAFGFGSAPIKSAMSIRGAGVNGVMSSTTTLNSAPQGQKASFRLTPAANVVVAPSDKDPVTWEGDIVAVGVHRSSDEAKGSGGGVKFTSLGEKIDIAMGGALSTLAQVKNFKAGPNSFVSTMVLGGDAKVKHIALIGMGKEVVKEENNGEGEQNEAKRAKKCTCDGKESLRAVNGFGEALSSLAYQTKCETMSVIMPNMKAALPQAMVAFYSGLYKDVRYKSENSESTMLKLRSVDLMGAHMKCKDGVDRVVNQARAISSGVNICKDLVNSPANSLDPVSMAKTAKSIAEKHGLKCVVLEEDEIIARGMGAYMGVAQGSNIPPKFIHLTYSGKGPVKRKLAIVGKGLTFDSGGYNLKVGGAMIELMKFDMGGAGAVLGTAQAIGELAPEGVEVHFIVAACENMLSDKAVRPGDILTASNGKTIEVINTDAEGRLTLADALVYAESQGVDACVDCATLTGSMLVALGKKYAGIFANDDELAAEVEAAASTVGERMWRMPLVTEYEDTIKSDIADLRNIGKDPKGGPIIAALFLKNFVGKMKWAHVDMAGPVWSHENSHATGYLVRTLSEWVLSSSRKS